MRILYPSFRKVTLETFEQFLDYFIQCRAFKNIGLPQVVPLNLDSFNFI